MTGHDETRQTSATKLTCDEFLLLPGFEEDGLRHELIDGEHYVTPSPFIEHQRVVGELHLALATFLKSNRLGEVFLAPLDVVLSEYDVVEPDLLVVLEDQSQILTRKHVRGAPAIVIEVLSPGTRRRDETIKRSLYARAGVREYWMVDTDARVVVACRASAPGALEVVTELAAAGSDTLTSPLLPGFSLPLLSLFGKEAT